MNRSRRHHIYFFLCPPPAVRREIAYWCAPAMVGTPVAENRLHVTIGTAGGYDETPHGVIDLIVEALADRPLPDCVLLFDTIIGARGQALLKPSEPLRGFDALQTQIAQAIGLDPALWSHIRPHVTLGYRGPAAPARPIDPISWTADSVCLVESLYGETRHIVHARWPLKVRTQRAA
jgi:2'-5' RNA ligase